MERSILGCKTLLRALAFAGLLGLAACDPAASGAGADAGATLETVDDVLRVIDRRTPGFRFRIVDERGRLRPHVRIFHESRPIGGLDTRVEDGDELFIAAALSGG